MPMTPPTDPVDCASTIEPCLQSPVASMPKTPQAVQKACEQFNQKQFWASHETLEALWLQSEDSDKLFLQGLIQIAAALHHFQNRNQAGMVSLLTQGVKKLQSIAHYPKYHAWMNLGAFIATHAMLLSLVKSMPEEEFKGFTLSKWPRWRVFS